MIELGNKFILRTWDQSALLLIFFFNYLICAIIQTLFFRAILLNSYLSSVDCDWQSLVTGQKSPKAVALSHVVHHLTGSKETIKLLYRSGAGISYDDVTKQIKSFLAEVQNNLNLAPKNVSKGQPTHITIDNFDEHQQTLTGLDTTNHTNATVYNPKNQNFNNIPRSN